MRNDLNNEQDDQPMMILTIDIGNGHFDKLQLFDLNNIEQETYDFCVKNKLDFNTMQEINNQIENVLKDKQFQEEQAMDNIFQEIKEEEENDERITDNNINEDNKTNEDNINDDISEEDNYEKNDNKLIVEDNNKNKQESIIIPNSNEICLETAPNENINSNYTIENENNNINNNINDEENKNEIINDKKNDNNIDIKNNINEEDNKNENKTNKSSNKSKESNNSLSKTESNQSKKDFKFRKKSIKENIKDAISMAKEQTKEKDNILNKDINNNSNLNSKKIIKQEKDNDKSKENKNNKSNQNIEPDDNSNIRNKIIEKNQNENNSINNKIPNNIKNIPKCNNEKNKSEKNIKNNENIINQNVSNIQNNNNISKERKSSKKKYTNKSASNKTCHINNFNNYNPGKELYKRGLKYLEDEKEKLEALKNNLEIDDLEENTFAPKINKISQTQNDKRREKKLECSNPEIIKNYKQYKESKLEFLKQKTDKDFNKIHTFKPIINQSFSTTKINRNNNNDENAKSTFERLYDYRIDYKENNDKLKEKIYNEYSFKPQINENSIFYKMNIPFNERLQTYSNKTKENMIKIQQEYEKELGYNKSFKPQLNDKKNKDLIKDRDTFFLNEIQKLNLNLNKDGKEDEQNNNNIIDPFTKLYLYGKKYEQEKNFLTEKYYQNINKNPQFNEINEEIINKKKEKSFKRIFKLLDEDEDGKISPTHISISRLPKNIQIILSPIFNELREENETLNEVEFVFVCQQLYLSLPWSEQRELTTLEDMEKKILKKEKILKEKNNYSFKPKINKKRNLSFENPTKLYVNNSSFQNNNKNNRIKNINNSSINKNKSKEKIGLNKINNNISIYKNNIPFRNNEIEINANGMKKNNEDNKQLNISNNYRKDNYSILRNTEINIIGKNYNTNIKNKKSSKRINYENFINVKAKNKK